MVELTKPLELTGGEARQLYNAMEFSLKDFRKHKKEGVIDEIMSPQESAKVENKLLELQHKLMHFAWLFPENNGEG